MRARPATASLAAVALAIALGAAAAHPGPSNAARAAAAAAPPVIADDLALPLRDWQRKGSLKLDSIRTRDGKALELSGSGRLARSLVHNPGAVSLDVKLSRGAALSLGLGSKRLTLRTDGRGRLAVRAAGFSATVGKQRGWRAGWWHVELWSGGAPNLAIQGRPLRASIAPRGPLTLHAVKGAPRVAALVATQRGDSGALFLHRLAELHARVELGEFPFGSGSPRGALHDSDGWTSGFWPGSLWRGWDRTAHSRLLRGWALAATLKHFGHEREQIHDQGFLYLESSAAAYDRLCKGSRAKTRTCRRLRKSALTAAGTLVKLQRGNPGAGTIPTLPAKTRCRMCRSKAEAETIVDSMMNVSLYDWAFRHTRDQTFKRLALRHSRAVAKLLVRADGSTAQAARVRRSDGKLIARETHQGLSAKSTWSRGQGWAVYGFAYTGSAFGDAQLVGVSEKAASYVDAHLPAGGVPRWDYDAPAGAPIDTSAGVITAAGLFRLADACQAVPGACTQPDKWRPLAERMLAASLKHVRRSAPLGYLANQVFSRGGHARWDDEGDFIFGTAYGLEAVASAGSG